MTKTIKKSELKADIDAGMKREALAAKYTNGNNSELTRLLKQAELKIRKFKNPSFVLENDLENDLENPVENSNFTSEQEDAMQGEVEEAKMAVVEEEDEF